MFDEIDFDKLFKEFRKLKILINDENKDHHMPADIQDLADVSGAGDRVISLAGLCLSAGLKALEIIAISNIARGQVCEKTAVVPVGRIQLLDDLKSLATDN